MALVTGRARDTFQVIPALIGQEGRLARAPDGNRLRFVVNR